MEQKSQKFCSIYFMEKIEFYDIIMVQKRAGEF